MRVQGLFQEGCRIDRPEGEWYGHLVGNHLRSDQERAADYRDSYLNQVLGSRQLHPQPDCARVLYAVESSSDDNEKEDTMIDDADHCKATVYHRDTYRRTGRGKTGFELHYHRRQCKRKALANGYCRQHQNLAEAV